MQSPKINHHQNEIELCFGSQDSFWVEKSSNRQKKVGLRNKNRKKFTHAQFFSHKEMRPQIFSKCRYDFMTRPSRLSPEDIDAVLEAWLKEG